jgi:hypothetical protein
VHLACGAPVTLSRECDVQSVSNEVIKRLEGATIPTTYHLTPTWRAIRSTASIGLAAGRLRRAAGGY